MQLNIIHITDNISISLTELDFSAIRAQGAGGQNVNKVSSAVHLRFDIANSSLPDFIKERLLALKDGRVSNDGIFIIKAQQFRTQEKNRADAIARLREFIVQATIVQKPRRATKPSYSARQKRVDKKNQRGSLKKSRQKVDF